ncbi:MAG: DUF362 domain-containing protein, partial [Sedimentisphaerales bacterium]|nr:DUF362 domain-containing protein [Sedimentisphaerales bacterium]
MPCIAALGPESTFSALAARIYAEEIGGSHTAKLYPTIGKVFAAVGPDCEYGLFPIETMTEGYVSIVLDLLVHSRFNIVHEMLLPVQFSLVANCLEIEEIKKIYAQFVTQGQCEIFLDSLSNTDVVTTQSNGISLEQVRKGIRNEAALVPFFSVKEGDFPLIIENINDYSNNQTRFIVIHKEPAVYLPSRTYKTSLLIFESVDKPGVLSSILTAFSSRQINMVSIMSRPTKEMLGRYHFFIDIEGHIQEDHIRAALQEIEKENSVKMLGSYPKAAQPLDIERYTSITDQRPGRSKTSLTPTPFAMDAARPSVFVVSGNGPYENTRQALTKIDLSPARGKKVLLKPNAGRDVEPQKGITTHPQVVAAAIDAFQAAGADVAVGESPITGVKTLDALDRCGIKAVADERNCPLIDMDARRYSPLRIPDGVAIDILKLCREVLEYDIIVSIPVMKTHMHTGVTLSVKNMKGCLWRRSKVDLHMVPEMPDHKERTLNIAIADMSSVLRPHLSIIDGTIGMEGLGPSAGTPVELGVVIIGVEPFATDAVACELMGISAGDIPHLRLASERGYGIIDLDKISVAPDNWQDL